MDRVYEGVVHWADVIVIATPIRWGGASSLYYKMIERMNCIQNLIRQQISDRTIQIDVFRCRGNARHHQGGLGLFGERSRPCYQNHQQ
jgi:multimeric flavodoxin WrbA